MPAVFCVLLQEQPTGHIYQRSLHLACDPSDAWPLGIIQSCIPGLVHLASLSGVQRNEHAEDRLMVPMKQEKLQEHAWSGLAAA